MKKQMLASVMTIGLLLVLTATSGRAQGLVKRMTLDVPFTFNVGQETLPAARYVVSVAPTTILIRSKDGHQAVMILPLATLGSGRQNVAKLVFNRYGERYFLAEVWVWADGHGYELSKTRAERAVAQKIGHKKTVLMARRK